MANIVADLLFGPSSSHLDPNNPGTGFIARIINLLTETNSKIDAARKDIIEEIRKNGSGKPDQTSLDKLTLLHLS